MLNKYHIMGYKCIISTFQQLKEDALALNRKKKKLYFKREGSSGCNLKF